MDPLGSQNRQKFRGRTACLKTISPHLDPEKGNQKNNGLLPQQISIAMNTYLCIHIYICIYIYRRLMWTRVSLKREGISDTSLPGLFPWVGRKEDCEICCGFSQIYPEGLNCGIGCVNPELDGPIWRCGGGFSHSNGAVC